MKAPRRPLDTEAAIARYYRDFLLGRALPPDDHLAALFDRLERRDVAATHHSPKQDGVTGWVGPPLGPRKAHQTRHTVRRGLFRAGDDNEVVSSLIASW